MLSVPGARSKNDVERQETTGVQNPANIRLLENIQRRDQFRSSGAGVDAGRHLCCSFCRKRANKNLNPHPGYLSQIMEDIKNTQISPFNEACRKILFERPEAIGVAYKILDCGCALLCGTSAGGDPTGPLQHISGQLVKKGTLPPICLKCKKDNGLSRVVWDGIYWPGSQSEWPDKDLRISIGRKIFGPGYLESE